MPMTFLSHQAVVLPLKIGAPRVTSGTALMLGSIAPDVEYFIRGYPTSGAGHTWLGQITFCLPVTLALFWVVTRVIAEPVAAHLPPGGELRLRDYALIRHQPGGARHWMIVAISAIIGSSSHLVLDVITDGWGDVPYHALSASPAWIAVNIGLWVVLAGVTLLLMRYMARNDLLRRWAAERTSAAARGGPNGASRQRSADPERGESGNVGAFWGWVLLCTLAGAILGARNRLPGFLMSDHATWVHIWLVSVSSAFAGLVLASLAWYGVRSWQVQLRGGQQ